MATEVLQANRLADCASPYLQQHADNPVHWQPWDDAALAAARELDRPLLLSIGYSACHWCHVMAHESFEDPGIAKLENEHFVPLTSSPPKSGIWVGIPTAGRPLEPTP